jgi:hypothetical protein
MEMVMVMVMSVFGKVKASVGLLHAMLISIGMCEDKILKIRIQHVWIAQ